MHAAVWSGLNVVTYNLALKRVRSTGVQPAWVRTSPLQVAVHVQQQWKWVWNLLGTRIQQTEQVATVLWSDLIT